MISHKELLEAVDYNPETGVFTWLKSDRAGWAGKRAGCPDSRGYRRINIRGTFYKTHRLAWFYLFGVWPDNAVDHMDGDTTNDAFWNLRDVTLSVNQQNQRKPRSDNTSGYLGVSKRGAKFVAHILDPATRKNRWLGTFESAEAAHRAYLVEKRATHQGCTI